jgi:hypothetical protein
MGHVGLRIDVNLDPLSLADAADADSQLPVDADLEGRKTLPRQAQRLRRRGIVAHEVLMQERYCRSEDLRGIGVVGRCVTIDNGRCIGCETEDSQWFEEAGKLG